MNALLVGATGFLIFYPTDWLQLRGAGRARAALLLLGSAVQAYGIALALSGPVMLNLPAPVGWMGWVLLPAGMFLLVYSLFLEIPFAKAFSPIGDRPALPERLVTTGTYALTRHPGVLWYALFVLGLFLVSSSSELLLAGPAWVAMDVVWVVLQDRIFFPRILPGYREYARSTPMLIPTPDSVAACLRTVPRLERRRHGDSS